MGRLRAKRRKHQIKVKQRRKAKLAKLRSNYAKAKNNAEKEKILEKVNKISPDLSKDRFLKSGRAPLSSKVKN